MNKSFIILSLSLLSLAASHTVCAEQPGLPSSPDRDTRQWRSTDGNMSPEDYRQAYQHNQHVLFDQLKSFSENALHSIGVSKTGTEYLGAAASLAVNQGAKLHLNESRNLALEFTDIGKDERAVIFGFSLDW
jgi:hypothetical protein